MGKRKREPVMRTMPPSDKINEMLSAYDSTNRYLVALVTEHQGIASQIDDITTITPGPVFTVDLWGDHHPTVFTTLRNAVRTATEHPSWHTAVIVGADRVRALEAGRPTYGFVLQLDLASLPVIDLANPKAVVFDDMNELAFAERQADWWANRVATLSKTGKYG